MRNIKYILIGCLTLLTLGARSQSFSDEKQQELDSLNVIISNANSPDTARAGAYLGLSEILYVINLDTIVPLCENASRIALEALPKEDCSDSNSQYSLISTLAGAYNNLGYIYGENGNIQKQTKYYEQSLEMQKRIADKEGMAVTLSNMGTLMHNQGHVEEALNYYDQSLKLKEEMGNKRGMSITLNNMGYIYDSQDDTANAMEFYKQSLKIREEIGYQRGIAMSLNNIGAVHETYGEFQNALDCYTRSLKIRREINDLRGVAGTLNNIGFMYKKVEDYDKALKIYTESYEIRKELNDLKGMAVSLNNMALIYMKQGNIQQAKEHATKSFEYANESKSLEQTIYTASTLSVIARAQGEYQVALDMYELHIEMRDSLKNVTNEKASIRQQTKHEYEKQKVLDDAINEKKLALEHAENERQQLISIGIASGLFLIVLFAIFIYRRLQITKQQKVVIEEQSQNLAEANEELNQTNEEVLAQRDEIERQKQIVEHAHGEVQASINYAERIQNALLSTEEHWQNLSTEHFILFKPRDVVSGDFYWAYSSDNLVFWVAADCTGHGVPGAFMSMLGVGFLNEIVAEGGETDAGKILDILRIKIIKALEQTGEEERKDGMDLALCILDKTTNKLQFAGAYNPLFIVRPKENEEPTGFVKKVEGEQFNLYEFKASRMPIGRYIKNDPFKAQEIQLIKGDQLYTFTDGYQDQFGGPQEGKFMVKRMKKLIVENAANSMEAQHDFLNSEFESWKNSGNQEQIDDVCIIGVSL